LTVSTQAKLSEHCSSLPKETEATIRSGFLLKSLTNYFIASNQIVKQLRRLHDEYELLRKVKTAAGLESRLSRARHRLGSNQAQPRTLKTVGYSRK
jgi:hypothetical protein